MSAAAPVPGPPAAGEPPTPGNPPAAREPRSVSEPRSAADPPPAGLPPQLRGPDGIVQRVRLAAYAWAEQDGSVLLCRIGPGIPGAGRWTLPGGGLDFGEDPAAGVLRELEEETGLRGRVLEILGVTSGVVGPEETLSGHRLHAVGIAFRVEVADGRPRDETGGTTDCAAWHPVRDLEALPGTALLAWARGLVGR